MNPAVSLISPAVISVYISPDNLDSTPLEDWELGGIGLSDSSQGLMYQSWHLVVSGTGVNTAVYVDAPNTPSTFLFSLQNITWARLAFDQNMRPVVSYVAGSGPGFWWWDPTIPGVTFTSLPSSVISPCVTMDDKRDLQTRLGNNDVVMCYINSGDLCYRLQRDRYGIEYVWLNSVNLIVSNPYVNKIGMSEGLRLRIEIRGALYL